MEKVEENIMDENEKIDFECPICLEIMFKPARTPCKHFFCLSCLKNHMEYETKCPMCRHQFEESYKPIVSLK
jgi:hypothetical protein